MGADHTFSLGNYAAAVKSIFTTAQAAADGAKHPTITAAQLVLAMLDLGVLGAIVQRLSLDEAAAREHARALLARQPTNAKELAYLDTEVLVLMRYAEEITKKECREKVDLASFCRALARAKALPPSFAALIVEPWLDAEREGPARASSESRLPFESALAAASRALDGLADRIALAQKLVRPSPRVILTLRRLSSAFRPPDDVPELEVSSNREEDRLVLRRRVGESREERGRIVVAASPPDEIALTAGDAPPQTFAWSPATERWMTRDGEKELFREVRLAILALYEDCLGKATSN